MAIKFAVSILIACSVIQMCSGSAIPIWEFLTREEKMSHLYSTFAKLVSDYCRLNNDVRTQSTAQCKRDLLNYGSNKLQAMSSSQMDLMDPYQRGAAEIIWENIMKNHPTVKTLPTRRPSPSASSSSAVILGNTNGKNPLFDDVDSGDNPVHLNLQPLQAPHRQSYLTGPLVIRVRPDGTPVEEDKHKPLPRDEDRELFQYRKGRVPVKRAYRTIRKH